MARALVDRIDLADSDVVAIEVIEDGFCVRLALYDEADSLVPLVAALLDREARRRLIESLLRADIARVRRSA